MKHSYLNLRISVDTRVYSASPTRPLRTFCPLRLTHTYIQQHTNNTQTKQTALEGTARRPITESVTLANPTTPAPTDTLALVLPVPVPHAPAVRKVHNITLYIAFCLIVLAYPFMPCGKIHSASFAQCLCLRASRQPPF